AAGSAAGPRAGAPVREPDRAPLQAGGIPPVPAPRPPPERTKGGERDPLLRGETTRERAPSRARREAAPARGVRPRPGRVSAFGAESRRGRPRPTQRLAAPEDGAFAANGVSGHPRPGREEDTPRAPGRRPIGGRCPGRTPASANE